MTDPLEEGAKLAGLARTIAQAYGTSAGKEVLAHAVVREGLPDRVDLFMRLEDMIDNLVEEVWRDYDRKREGTTDWPSFARDLISGDPERIAKHLPQYPPSPLIEGLCGNREKREPHDVLVSSLGPYCCHADQSRRLPYAAEQRRDAAGVDHTTLIHREELTGDLDEQIGGFGLGPDDTEVHL